MLFHLSQIYRHSIMKLYTKIYIALGSNLDNPLEHLTQVLVEIDQLPDTNIVKKSSFYRTKPIGPDQPDIINAVIEISTGLSPYPLLHALQKIELSHKRERIIRFGARTLDLDILLYGNISMDDEELTIPHPRMQDRNFVLVPLHEIAGNIELPNHGNIEDLMAKNDPEDYVIPLDPQTFGNNT